jgi:hypothetical protein
MSDTWSTGSSSTGTGVQERASEVAGTAKEQAGEVAATAKEQAKTVAADAKHEARRLLDDSRRQLRDQAGEQQHRAASSLRDLGDQLHRMASGQSAGEGPAADWARQASQGIQRFADSLDTKQPEDLLADVKRFARERPGVFLLGALGAGFAAGRLFRAVDTATLTDAAKSGAGIGQGAGDMVSGPGALGMPAASTTHPPRTEPLRAPDTTGSEW